MMPFLLAESANLESVLPLYVCCVGSHEQRQLDRSSGYPAHQLFLCRSGTGIFRIEGRPDLALTPGTALLIPANVKHAYFPDSSGEVWDLGFVAFRGSASTALLEQMSGLLLARMHAPGFGTLWKQLESLWHLISQNGEQAYWEASRKMYEMLLTLLEGQMSEKKTIKAAVAAGQPNPGLQTAVQLMHDHYNERLLLANVARAAGYSVQHFHRLFVESYGVTPQRYLLQLRMRRAVQLLEGYPGITVGTTADMLGMETSYFIRMFKRTYKITPKKYMEQFPSSP